jgi:hypothetical protein
MTTTAHLGRHLRGAPEQSRLRFTFCQSGGSNFVSKRPSKPGEFHPEPRFSRGLTTASSCLRSKHPQIRTSSRGKLTSSTPDPAMSLIGILRQLTGHENQPDNHEGPRRLSLWAAAGGSVSFRSDRRRNVLGARLSNSVRSGSRPRDTASEGS